MDEESGFFSPPPAATQSAATGLHDFTLLHESERGFCRVFAAKQDGRLFVVKALRTAIASETVALTALRKEYDAGFAVDSPRVARTLYMADIPALGQAIVMEYCPGASLEALIDKGYALEWPAVDTIVGSLLAAVDDIHAAGIIHRDIKPSNIIFSPSTSSLKVIDFGCADADSFYALRNPAGTERYTRPAADSSGPDIRNDFYAVGITLSQLAFIAPPSRRRALEVTAAAITSGALASSADILRLYTSRCRRRYPRPSLIAVGGALILSLLAAVFLIPGRSAVDAAIADTSAGTTSALAGQPGAEAEAPVEIAASVDGKPPETAPGQQEHPAQSTVPETAPYTGEAAWPSASGSESLETFVVRRTDTYVAEWLARSAAAGTSADDRHLARLRYSSPDSVTAQVLADAARFRPGAETDTELVSRIAKARHAFLVGIIEADTTGTTHLPLILHRAAGRL